MVAFSKITRDRTEQIAHLLKSSSSRRPLYILLVALLVVRGAIIHKLKDSRLQESKSKDKASETNAFGLRTIPQSRLAADARHFPPLPPAASSKPNIDYAFARQLAAIVFRVAIPKWYSRESFILLAHSLFLVMRTVLSVAVARLDGRIVRDLVRADKAGFARGLGLWFALAVPSIYTNSMIRHLQSVLAIRFRTRLTRYIHDLYLSSAPNYRYYRVPLEGVDQYITADVEAWADSIAGIYGNLLKPTLDMLLFTSQLAQELGFRGTVLLFVNYYITGKILRAATPAFGKLAAVEARLEGEYRTGVGRVGREGEEIAFYDGGSRERDILTKAYLKLVKHVNSIYKIRIAYEWTEDFVIKYLWSAAGYGLIAVPLLITRKRKEAEAKQKEMEKMVTEVVDEVIDHVAGEDEVRQDGSDDVVAGRTETYISNRRLLLSLADAGGRLMFAYKDVLELAGLTTRLYTLLSELHNLPPLPKSTLPVDGDAHVDSDSFTLSHVDVRIPYLGTASDRDTPAEPKVIVSGEDDDEKSVSSEPDENALLLVRDLSLHLRRGEHLMITGSNGVGKTAVARVLAGLWAPSGPLAELRRPAPSHDVNLERERPGVFVVPQRAYHPTGTLLGQVVYPHTVAQFYESGRSEEEIQDILESVFLGYLVGREGGWDVTKEWRDVLSGGEKQRMAMARVFYHCPKFAILDECTSAVSGDVEGQMYEHAKLMGITLITISLRPSLTKYHNNLLTLTGDGTGSWMFSRIGENEPGSPKIDRSRSPVVDRFSEEIKSLEKKLSQAEQWQTRVKELEGMLHKTDA
ncbi:hypothetical protein CONPUDRAFT_129429 [Coniophora puteana RWD-64-598 SS2]|uniref:ABC transporter domain-containing protein n=1 Tax=Coniophora puteana (strain RWD-64-598) TaxID=741705 RepID=A0A5M3MF09_CONPW|nr:uncharacterized protein CONPUDRAFT_129429 [Coniophora puteana RWD-64-598 SS2]EIW77195.1 hypothetical protein CONPUDRAFT_129429 [Coniophora puteana RWD-64-598 SS2]